MEINKEREAFEASLTKMKIHNLRVGTIFDTEKNEYFASDVLHPSEDHIVRWINFSWKLWQEKTTPEGFVLMPIKPTETMVMAVAKEHEGDAFLPYSIYDAYVKQALIEAREQSHDSQNT
ncbi:hypothetical protein ACG9ZL_18695 [Acinetobacter sp. ULE_I057]|uniref:hypothetical protein n=1 Tax=Acinetobacter sp. ULE_I057 TaxID=3373070 RepID=UPI003AF8A096